MNVVDVIFILVVVLSILLGLWRGVTREILGVSSWVIAAVCAYFFYPLVVPVVRLMVSHSLLTTLLSVAAVFFLVLVVFSAITYALSDSVKSSIVGGVDRGLGGIYGLARGVFLISAIAFLSQKTAFKTETKTPLVVQKSILWPVVASFAEKGLRAIPESTIQTWRGHVDEIFGEGEDDTVPKPQDAFPEIGSGAVSDD